MERGVPSFQTVFERAERFSARVRQLDLTGSERRILALVDGRAGVQELVDRSGIPTKEAAHVLFRLAEVGLLRRRAGLLLRQKVMILEPDVEGFRRPLAALLGSRPRPADLLALDEASDLVAAVLRERPALVLLNVAAVGADQAKEISRALCAQPDAVGRVVALLEPDAAVDDLVESPHFDAVLTKPIHISEIERLLPG